MQSMDPTKKRKLDVIVNASSSLEPDPITKDEVVIASSLLEPDPITKLTPQDGRKQIERFTVDQLRDIFQDAVARHFDVLSTVRSITDQDSSQRKLFIRGLGRDTTTDSLRLLFSAYGELEDAVVIVDNATGKSRGYGFVTFKHVDGALLALKKPGKKIDGRLTVSQLAAPHNIHSRKIYVANVPYEMPAEKLLGHFAQYGEIEKGPLGFDRQTGKSGGIALFVYKTAEGAQAALVEPVKNIDGKLVYCKLASEGKIGKPGQDGKMPSGGGAPWNAEMGIGGHSGGYGGPGGPGVYGGFSSSLRGPPVPMGHAHHWNPSGVGVRALGGTGGGPGSGYGAGLGGPYGGYPESRLPLTSVGIASGSGGSPESAHYSLSSSAAFPCQHIQGAVTFPVHRVPPGGMHPNRPPFY